MKLEEINEIISKKWDELDREDEILLIKEEIESCSALEDFLEEFEALSESLQSIPKEHAIFILKGHVEKWAYIFSLILDVDLYSPFSCYVVYQALIMIQEENI